MKVKASGLNRGNRSALNFTVKTIYAHLPLTKSTGFCRQLIYASNNYWAIKNMPLGKQATFLFCYDRTIDIHGQLSRL